MAECTRPGPGTPSSDEDDDIFSLEEKTSPLSQTPEQQWRPQSNKFVRALRAGGRHFFTTTGPALTSEAPESSTSEKSPKQSSGASATPGPDGGEMMTLTAAVADLNVAEGAHCSQKQESSQIFFPDNFVCPPSKKRRFGKYRYSKEQGDLIDSFQRTSAAFDQLRMEKGLPPGISMIVPERVIYENCDAETARVSALYIYKRTYLKKEK